MAGARKGRAMSGSLERRLQWLEARGGGRDARPPTIAEHQEAMRTKERHNLLTWMRGPLHAPDAEPPPLTDNDKSISR
jgi:hypothetical protein